MPRADVFSRADVVLMVRAPGREPGARRRRHAQLRQGQVVIGFAEPLTAHEATEAVAARGASLFSMELIPRITRAQSMDALSSMASIAGYKAVLLAASELPRMFPMMNDGRRHDRARRGSSSSAPASPACRRSRPRGAWAPASKRTTCVRPSRSRWKAWAPASWNCRSRRPPRRTRAATPRRRTRRSIGGSAS